MQRLDYRSRDSVLRSYEESGKKAKDDIFRKKLELGPTERRWLGWSGARVLVIEAYLAVPGELCPTSWRYRFKSLGNPNGDVLDCSEVNFCDDEDVEDLMFPWDKTEDVMRGLREDIAAQKAPMYYI